MIWGLVLYVWRRSRSALHPYHDVTSQSIDIDSFKADASGEAGHGGGNVAAHLGNSLQLGRWLVAVQMAQTKHILLGPHRIGE